MKKSPPLPTNEELAQQVNVALEASLQSEEIGGYLDPGIDLALGGGAQISPADAVREKILAKTTGSNPESPYHGLCRLMFEAARGARMPEPGIHITRGDMITTLLKDDEGLGSTFTPHCAGQVVDEIIVPAIQSVLSPYRTPSRSVA